MDEERHEDVYETGRIGKLRWWFRQAIDHAQDWRLEAKEDYDFVNGEQWSEDDKRAFAESGRPAITINRIKPLMNVLSGYQRLNRYDIDFVPRTGDDIDLCKVRKGITKFVLDACDYNSQESAVFLDASICGIGWFDVGYRFDPETSDGEAFVERQDPFGVYVDPEAHDWDFSDAKYICRAKWVDKDELQTIYPEHRDEIEMQYEVYDKAEKQVADYDSRIWYQKDLKKIRLVECWYKVKVRQTMYYLADGSSVPQQEITVAHFAQGLVAGMRSIYVTRVRVGVFFDRVLLEDIESPYLHGEFPLIPLVCYHVGPDSIPAGFVRDLKDPQREINRRRIQELHILNTSSNGGGFFEEGAMTPVQEEEFRRKSSMPGHFQKLQPGGLAKVQERAVQQPPAAVIQAESQATQDLTAISGINEALMGTDVASSASGRAIELKQKQAITHIAPMFDHLRKAKKKVASLLWGRRLHPGIIPQYYTEDKVYRVEGENGQQFIRVNQQVAQQDPLAGTIYRTLNDLSQGEFDIVIADTEASTTQRQAQMWGLVDAVSKLGVPGDMVFDIILDLSDLPDKEAIKERYAQRQQQQANQAQAQMQLEMIKNQNMNQSIAFKDAPLAIQFAMAAKQGLVDPQVAQYVMDITVQRMFPQLAEQMQAQKAQQQDAQMQAQQQQAQAILQQQQAQRQGQAQQNGSVMTDAAARSMMAGAAPGAL